MEPTPCAACGSEAQGLEDEGKEGNQAEKLAKSFLDAGDVSRESMLAVLGKWSFAPNIRRVNVTRLEISYVFSDNFGLLRGSQGWSPDNALCRMLSKL